MSDTAHILEEMRSLRGAHAEVLASLSDVCVQVRELVIELRHTQRNYDSLNERMMKNEVDIRALQLDAALNKPILDIAKAINTKMLITIASAVVAFAGMNVDWSKLVGG